MNTLFTINHKSLFCFRLLVVLSFIFLLGGSAMGQVRWSLANSLSVQAGVNAVQVEIHNDQPIDFKGSIQLVLPKGLISLNNQVIPVQVVAGKKKFVTIRLQSHSLSLLHGKSIQAQLLQADATILLQQDIHLDVPIKRMVIMQDQSSLQYLRQAGDSIRMEVRVMNNGTRDETIRVLFSSADRLGKVVFREVNINLLAGVDTLLREQIRIEPYMLSLANYTVQVTGLYSNNDVFGNLSLAYSNISSSRNYQKMFAVDRQYTGYSSNYVELRLGNVLEDQMSYNLNTAGTYRVGAGKLQYSGSLNRWGGDSRWHVNNTFVSYSTAKHALLVGNLQENLEAPFYGRGGSYSYSDSSRRQVVSVGWVQRSGDLFGQDMGGNSGYTAFGRLRLGEGAVAEQAYEGQVIYDHNPMDSVNSILWTNRFDIIRPNLKNTQLQVFLGGGLQKSLQDQRMVPAGAVGLRWNQQLKNWRVTSDNFYSTDYFPGNRRGALQFNQRLQRQFGQTQLSTGYLYNRYTPRSLNPRYSSFHTSMSRWDMQLMMPLLSAGQWSVIPSFNKERSEYQLGAEMHQLHAQSTLLMVTANMPSENRLHRFFLTAEGGQIAIDQVDESRLVFRTEASYNYKQLGLFGHYQGGPFQVYDMMTALFVDRPFGDRYTLGARLNGTIGEHKLTWSSQVSAQLNAGWGKSINGYAQAIYKIANQTQLQANVQYTYSVGATNYSYDYVNLQVGIRQNLKATNVDRKIEKSGALTVFCYYDQNFNNRYDPDDQIAYDYGFMVRNILFVTNKAGEGSFKKLPYGRYSLFFPLKNRYQAVSQEVVIAGKHTRVEVALQRVGTILGEIELQYNPALDMSIVPKQEGYKIIAQHQDGRIFSVASDVSGKFMLQLPPGNYTLKVDSNSLPEFVYPVEEYQLIKVDISKELKLSPILLKVKPKKIEIKRFGVK